MDGTFLAQNAVKKQRSASAAILTHEDFDGANPIDVFNLPARSVVTNVAVVTESAGQALLTLKVDVGATEAVAAANVAQIGVASAATPITTGTGATVKVTPSAAPTAGSFAVIVEYVEYTVGTGMLTNYS